MKAIELLESYPKAAEVIGEFYRSKMIESLNTQDIPDEFKELIKNEKFDNQYISTFIDANPRILFDVFDAHDLQIGITPNFLIGGMNFKYTIATLLAGEEPTRVEAEKKAITLALQLLNDKL